MGIMIPAWVEGELSPVDKLEAHEKGLKHRTVSVFVVRETEILLQRRAPGKYHTPGLWSNTCCTHPQWNESASACAVRRLHEELGITGLYPENRQRLGYHADVGNGLVENEVVDVFLAHVRGPPTIVPDPDEVMDIRWIDYHDLLAEVQRHPARFTSWLKIYLHNHPDSIFGPDLNISANS